ncbi:putative oxidoreductase of aldo/keto reductase family [Sphaerochaeta pleomorpha str. Grapes]|uniref:Putative oxidoreductase of aldo/keto reductase family n=1 Tax=Sphaerochaeta pleomorpha (strain ATCC BAA-1885 / DSM 22778 / Grapes) TaxID=158190 RepID=G8QT11_SPHPG|nr:aldo/keto reductase [Sphaerochaeta pleomorpha]AEV27916.1 putative oxidoreductase of aldo/keto reductase family [Sphaerochaeta pleomorpha str. Grapes]
MEKRYFEELDISTSLLGFGAMRLPLTEDGKIDEPLAEKMLDLAIANGVNYIDTAYPYHNGDSEPFVGRVLKKYARDSFFLATKLPQWLIKNLDDAKRIFEEQLVRLQTDYVDFYLLHSMDWKAFERMVSYGVVAYLQDLKKEGKIRYLGFSFHSSYEDFEKMLTYTDWDFCQLQYNYLDTEDQAGQRGYDLTEKLAVPLIVMEPIKGGSLAQLPPDLENKLKSLDSEASSASYALRWVGSHDNVKVILSGMSTLEQVEDNLKTFKNFKPLDKKEAKTVLEISNIMKSRAGNGCTGCKYCMPCPFGVDIPGNFSLWNKYRMFQNFEAVKNSWQNEASQKERPLSCTECGRCVPLCPQHIDIPSDLKRAQQELSSPQC